MLIKKKLKAKSGFTLAETLLAVLILLLVSVIVANGIPVARNVYNNVIVGANAQMLLSTAVTALRNELGTAQEISYTGTDIIYYKSSIGAYSKLSVDASTGIQLLDYVKKEDGTAIPVSGKTGTRTSHNLVSYAAANKNLIVTYDGVSIDNDVITVSNLEVKQEKGTKSTIVKLDNLNIRVVPIAG
ncbi:MAG: hypothetical protein IKE17_16025 [Clostridia bacterium]|nr:hypothetical protein [Clostridia bacterium]MBR2799229.1 hypothetical protein [Clostridia bacterium]